jgi:hypothetical protein
MGVVCFTAQHRATQIANRWSVDAAKEINTIICATAHMVIEISLTLATNRKATGNTLMPTNASLMLIRKIWKMNPFFLTDFLVTMATITGTFKMAVDKVTTNIIAIINGDVLKKSNPVPSVDRVSSVSLLTSPWEKVSLVR